jgi:hypothetical protein
MICQTQVRKSVKVATELQRAYQGQPRDIEEKGAGGVGQTLDVTDQALTRTLNLPMKLC